MKCRLTFYLVIGIQIIRRNACRARLPSCARLHKISREMAMVPKPVAEIDYPRRAIKSKDPPTGSERPPRIKLLSRSRILSKEVFIRELILNSDVGSNSFLWNRCLSRDKTNSGSNSETKEVTRMTSKPARSTLCLSSRDLYLRAWRA